MRWRLWTAFGEVFQERGESRQEWLNYKQKGKVIGNMEPTEFRRDLGG